MFKVVLTIIIEKLFVFCFFLLCHQYVHCVRGLGECLLIAESRLQESEEYETE